MGKVCVLNELNSSVCAAKDLMVEHMMEFDLLYGFRVAQFCVVLWVY